MTIVTLVEAKLTVPGVHHWPDAPHRVAHLRALHRHLFVIRAVKAVDHDDRDVEFQILKSDIEGWFQMTYKRWNTETYDFGTASCEVLAKCILLNFDLAECSVHEDDENGAIVRRIV